MIAECKCKPNKTAFAIIALLIIGIGSTLGFGINILESIDRLEQTRTAHDNFILFNQDRKKINVALSSEQVRRLTENSKNKDITEFTEISFDKNGKTHVYVVSKDFKALYINGVVNWAFVQGSSVYETRKRWGGDCELMRKAMDNRELFKMDE